MLALQDIARVQQPLAISATDTEVEHLCGSHHCSDELYNGPYLRWGTNPASAGRTCAGPGSARTGQGNGQGAETYPRLRNTSVDNQRMSLTLLKGISQRDYRQVTQDFTHGFGLSATSVRRSFIRRGTQVLEQFYDRSFESLDLVGIGIDGKHFARYQVVVCMGLTTSGEKVVLGYVQTPSERPSMDCWTS